MALLSPPSSRYAFEPSLTTSAIPPISVNSSAASAASATGSASVSATSTVNGGPYDMPPFEPKTQALLQNFTVDLRTFTNWISNLKLEQQKTVMDVFLDSLPDAVVKYVYEKAANAAGSADLNSANVAAAGAAGTAGTIKFSPPMSSAPIQPRTRPVSPLLMLNGDSFGGPGSAEAANSPLFSSILRSPRLTAIGSPAGISSPSGIASPMRIGSPVMASLMEFASPIARPQSAGLTHTSNTANAAGAPGAANPAIGAGSFYNNRANAAANSFYGGAISPLPTTPSAQPLFRVFSSDLDPTGFQRRTRDFFEDGSNADVGAQQFGLTSTTDFAGQNAFKLNHSLKTITRKQPLQSQAPQAPQPPQGPLQSQLVQRTVPQSPTGISDGGGGGGGDGGREADPLDSNDRGRAGLAGRSTTGIQTAHSALARAGQSLSVPPISRLKRVEHSSIESSGVGVGAGRAATSEEAPGGASGGISISPPSVVKSAAPQDIASRRLLENIPLWLKTLRLHKYTENLKKLQWKQMIELSDSQLEQLGVSTVGARNKLLKSFAYVKENLHE
ncbi:hypothetical protein FOA43_002104 [Brettanomyces nanus]|uniref:SAM domain-containing protein n=1 Tax=Eeniella nana TaxID=13502 RepID=A0A875RP99_EENNA|nr:uncharacterized protein FOA43_002104 [Brettanomyces nanus]QPG74770.1 hypothetical protein FOA43_002104 [Brettanomyces nanus]